MTGNGFGHVSAASTILAVLAMLYTLWILRLMKTAIFGCAGNETQEQPQPLEGLPNTLELTAVNDDNLPILLIPVKGALRIHITGALENVTLEKAMTSSMMRILAIGLLQAAEETENGVGFVRKIES